MSADWLVLGLGNPGEEYRDTRHNIGFRVAEHFVRKHRGSFTSGNGPWLEARLHYAGTTFLVGLPQTYMNRSGIAAKRLLAQEGLPPDRLIAVVDEYNFPVGRIHLKLGGSDGGHNGIASIIAELGTPQFWRLRCGIDRKFGKGELVDYVLSPFSPDELPHVEAMIADAVAALERIAQVGIARAVSEINAASKQTTRSTTAPHHGLGGSAGGGEAG